MICAKRSYVLGAKGVAVYVAGAVAIQFVPIEGEIENVLLVVGTLMAGGNILQGLKQLKQFKDFCCTQAKTPDDLNQAGKMAADAVATIGVNGLLAALPFIKGAKGKAAADEQAGGKIATQETAAGVSQRESTARDFYKQTGWSDGKIYSHVKGIDYTHPVDVITLPKGTQVVQYQIPGRLTGNYLRLQVHLPDQ